MSASTSSVVSLHPGAVVALQRLRMDELGIARAIAADQLTSPQKYHNVWLFAIRITGTGRSYRSQLREHVWRDPDLYLNDEFLARCNGLAVIWEHPEKAVLDHREFATRAIGSIMLPYIKDDEVWGIAKIYDENAARAMEDKQLSTSPSVVLKNVAGSKVALDDGSTLLLEGKPALLDHIAICPLGVWDQDGDPTGVRNDSERLESMADPSEKLDQLLALLGTVTEQNKALTMRMDAQDLRHRADARARMDAEREEWMKKDPESCARDDAEEETERKKYEGDGDDETTATDKARNARRDRMKARKDAEDEESKKKEEEGEKKEEKKDDESEESEEEKKKKREEDEVKADARIQRIIDERIKSALPRAESTADRDLKATTQLRADRAYSAFGNQAPPPMAGEDVRAYRIRLARDMQKHSKAWEKIDLTALPVEALDLAETTIYADSITASKNVDIIPAGQLLKFTRTDPDTGHRITEFRGKESVFKRMSAPTQRVTAFLTNNRGS